MKQNLTVEFAKANFGKKLSYIVPGYTRACKGEIIIEGIISNYEGANDNIDKKISMSEYFKKINKEELKKELKKVL